METITLDQYDECYEKKGIIMSGGLGPCIAVAVFNPKKKTVSMIHHPSMYPDTPLEIFLRTSTGGVRNKTGLEVYVVGCSIDNEYEDDMKANYVRSREYVEVVLPEWFHKNQLNIHWAKPNEGTELLIDTTTSEVIKTVNGISTHLNKASPDKPQYFDSNGYPID